MQMMQFEKEKHKISKLEEKLSKMKKKSVVVKLSDSNSDFEDFDEKEFKKQQKEVKQKEVLFLKRKIKKLTYESYIVPFLSAIPEIGNYKLFKYVFIDELNLKKKAKLLNKEKAIKQLLLNKKLIKRNRYYNH